MSGRGWFGERGIALAAALFVLVLLAAALAGIWFAAFQEYRVGANAVADRRALDAAESGLDAIRLTGWDAGRLNRLAVGDSVSFEGTLGGNTAGWSGAVVRLGPWLYLLRSTGRAAVGASRRTLAMVARLVPLRLPAAAALVSSGPVNIGAGTLVALADADSGSACAEAGLAAGVLLPDSEALSASSCPVGRCVYGDPPVAVDTTLRSAAVPLLGEEGWTDLVSAADTLRSGLGPWPSAPVWYADGDLSLTAGTRLGPVVLLVRGDLVLEGAELQGLVVVRGRLVIRGAGGRIVGAVLAGGADLSAFAGAQAAVLHSGCAVEEALVTAAPARALGERSWAAIY